MNIFKRKKKIEKPEGIAAFLICIAGYSFYHIREAERILPDFDSSKQGVSA